MDEAVALSWQVMTLRLLVAFVLGGVIGLERERRERPAGLRTHIVVTVAAALLMMISVLVAGDDFDPGRMAAGVITGIGFLGAGTIIRYGGGVRGLTTAATIWAASAVGLTVGIGWYPAAIVATLLVFFTLTVMRWIEPVVIGERLQQRVSVRLVPGARSCGELLVALRQAHVQITGVDFTDEEGRQLVLHCQPPRGMPKASLLEIVAEQQDVGSARFAP